MKQTQRWISLILCMALVLSAMPANAFAEQDEFLAADIVDMPLEPAVEQISDVELLASTKPISGYCGGEGDGTNLTWTLTTDGALTISGTGEMQNFASQHEVPWGQNLKSLVLTPGITTIGDYAFYSSKLTAVTIPSSVVYIGSSAFEFSKLSNIEMNEGLIKIGPSAFCGCLSLINVTIPDSVTYISDFAFSQCRNLQTLTLSDNLIAIGWGSFEFCNSLTRIDIPDSVISFGASPFAFCNSLTDVKLGKKLRFFEGFAFWNCTSLKSIELPNSGISTIPSGTFSGCSSLTNVWIPDSIKEIQSSAFEGCLNLVRTEYNGTASQWDEITIGESNEQLLASLLVCTGMPQNEVAYDLGSGTLYFDSEAGRITGVDDYVRNYAWEIVIPSKINGVAVTSIGAEAFRESRRLTSVTIPNSVTSIGQSAFWGCDNLEEVILPNSVSIIGDSAFASCGSLKSISVPKSVAYIGCYAFSRCSDLSSVALKEGITVIDSAFWSCNSLTAVTIPASVVYLDVDAFEFCENLSSVYFCGSAPMPEHYASTSLSTCADDVTIYYVPGTYGWTNSRYYDAESGTWDGQKLQTWGGNASGQLPDKQEEIQIETEQYYRTPENRLFYVHAVGNDSSSGFSITVDDMTFTSGDLNPYWFDAITVTIPDDYDGNISVVHENDKYYPFTFPAELAGQTNTITMIPRTITGPFAHALLQVESGESNRSYANLLKNVQYFHEVPIQDNSKPNIVQFYPLINWNGHGEGTVWLEQGSITVPLEPNEMNELDWSKCYFTGGKPIYLCVAGKDDAMTRTKTAITVYEKPGADIKLELGDALTIDTGDTENEKLSIFEKQELSIELPGDITNIELSVQGDGTVQGVLGLTFGELSHKESAFASTEKRRFRDIFKETQEVISRLKDSNQNDDLKGVTEYIDRLKKQGVKPAYAHGSFGVKGSVQIVGYLTGKITNTGFDLTELEAAVIVSGSVSYTHNTIVVVGAVPVAGHYKIALGAKIGAYISCKRDEILNVFVPATNYDLKGSVSLTGELGPGWIGYASCGLQGDGKVKIKSTIPIVKEETILSFQADLSLVGTLVGINGEWTLLKSEEKVFWNAGEWCWVDISELSSQPVLLFENASTTTQPVVFSPDFERNVMLFLGKTDAIAMGVNGYQAPALTELSNGDLLAVWVADVASRASIDKNGVYYSIFSDNVWSAPALVFDDGTNDSLPQLYSENGKICLAWQNYSSIFGAGSLPDYDTLSSQINTVSMIFDEDESIWVNLVEEQPEWYLAETDLPEDFEGEWPTTTSRRLQLETSNMRAVLYTASDSGGTTQVWGLFNDGISWGTPVQLTSSSTAVNCFSAVAENDKVTVLYTSGDRADALLSFCEVYDGIDVMLTEADYLHQTFSSGQMLTLKLSIKNNSIKTVNGVTITVVDENEKVYQEKVAVRLDSGEEDVLYVNYTLPNLIDFDRLGVWVSPNDAADIDDNNNYAECVFCTTDLSVEHVSAIEKEGYIGVLTQVVNRGQNITEETTIAYRKNAPDGDLIATQKLQSLEVGELVNVTTELRGITTGDLLYVEIIQVQEENLIANNSLQTMVSGLEIESNMGSSVIMDAEFRDRNVITQISCAPDTQNTAMIAAYDASGQMLEAYSYALNEGVNHIEQEIEAEHAVSVRVFLVDKHYKPQCSAITSLNKNDFRAEFAEALTRLTYTSNQDSLGVFADAERIDDACSDAVLRMYNFSLMVGDGKNFNPVSAITRAELAQIIYIALNDGVDDGAVAYADEDLFADVTADDWYAGYAHYCAEYNLGPASGYFNGLDPLTVPEAAKMIMCAMGYSAEACGFVGDHWTNNVLVAAEAVGLLDGFDYPTYTYIPRQWLAVMFCNAIDNA